jgi:hypothetical protein
MNTTTNTKRPYFTKAQISKAFTALKYLLDIKEIKESKCDALCWKESMRARARRFDVTLEDYVIRELAMCPATFKLRICNIPTKEGNVNVLFVRYYFHINVDVSKISIEEMSALTNNQNLIFGAMKTVLRNVTTDGYGFCTEIRCHVSDINDVVRCYDKYKWKILDIPVELLKRVSFYYRNKEGWDWKEKSVNPVGLDEFDNFYNLYPEHELSKKQDN